MDLIQLEGWLTVDIIVEWVECIWFNDSTMKLGLKNNEIWYIHISDFIVIIMLIEEFYWGKCYKKPWDPVIKLILLWGYLKLGKKSSNGSHRFFSRVNPGFLFSLFDSFGWAACSSGVYERLGLKSIHIVFIICCCRFSTYLPPLPFICDSYLEPIYLSVCLSVCLSIYLSI